MRAVDTNILVRYVANDDPKQAAVVEKFWVACESNQEAIFIPVLVLCELMRVLSRLYAQSKPQLIEILENCSRWDSSGSSRSPLCARAWNTIAAARPLFLTT